MNAIHFSALSLWVYQFMYAPPFELFAGLPMAAGGGVVAVTTVPSHFRLAHTIRINWRHQYTRLNSNCDRICMYIYSASPLTPTAVASRPTHMLTVVSPVSDLCANCTRGRGGETNALPIGTNDLWIYSKPLFKHYTHRMCRQTKHTKFITFAQSQKSI